MIFQTKNKKFQKIDEKDKKIITYLHNNLEISKKQLAKECNISIQNLNYKIQRLEELNILTPISLFNLRPFGFKHYNILISKISEKTFKKLQESKEITVIIEIFGEKRYFIEVISKNIENFLKEYLEFSEFELIELLSDHINELNLFKIPLNLKLFKDKEYKKNLIEAPKDIITTLNELSIFPKHSILSLSLKTGFHRQTISRQIQYLKESKILYKRIYAINSFSIGFQDYILTISFQQQEKDILIKLLQKQEYISIFSISYQKIVSYISIKNFNDLKNIVNEIETICINSKINYFELIDIIKIKSLPKILTK